MTKTKVLLIVAFGVTFAAGAAAGLLVSRAGRRPRGPSWLATELGLTDQQREQMHEIWSEAMQTAGRERWEQRHALIQKRDEAIAALMTEAQRAEYDTILRDYDAKREELEAQRKRAFEQAVERTKQILTPEQAAKYEDLLETRRDRGRGDRPGPPPPWGMRRPPPREPTETPEQKPPTPHGGEER